MKLSRPLALVLLLLIGAKARSDFIPYSYTWGGDILSFGGGNSTTGAGFVDQFGFSNAYSGKGSQENIPAVRVSVYGSATATFSPIPAYGPRLSLAMYLRDGPSNASSTLTFKGDYSGTIYNLKATIYNPIQTVTLGKDTYTVMINPFISPTATESRRLLTANVFVSGPDVNNVPEPASVVLIGLGLSTLGVRRWWRKLRPAGP
jgi:hypothetical protein